MALDPFEIDGAQAGGPWSVDPFEVDGAQAGGPDSGLSWGDIMSASNDLIKTGGQIFAGAQGAINAFAPYAGLAMSYVSAANQRVAAEYQKALYDVQALDTLRLAQIRTDMDRKYAAIQAGRKLKQAEMSALNYTIQGNTLLRTMERANAAVRARAAANGVAYNEGSAAGVQQFNVNATYRDVGISDLNALTARVLGYEDASSMYLAAEEQANLTMQGAEAQANQLRLAGQFAVASGGLLSGATLLQGGLDFAKTVRNPFT